MDKAKEEVRHANTQIRGEKPYRIGCGALRRGALVTGDPKLVTCKDCQKGPSVETKASKE